MDNKQAAAVLRTMSNPLGEPSDPYTRNCEMAAKRGADALKMLEWLLEFIPVGRSMKAIRVFRLENEWDYEGDFLAYCEAKFDQERKK